MFNLNIIFIFHHLYHQPLTSTILFYAKRSLKKFGCLKIIYCSSQSSWQSKTLVLHSTGSFLDDSLDATILCCWFSYFPTISVEFRNLITGSRHKSQICLINLIRSRSNRIHASIGLCFQYIFLYRKLVFFGSSISIIVRRNKFS